MLEGQKQSREKERERERETNIVRMTICVSKREGYRAGGREIPKIVKKNIVCGKERDKREREKE